MWRRLGVKMRSALQSKRMTTTLVGKMRASELYFDFAISTISRWNPQPHRLPPPQRWEQVKIPCPPLSTFSAVVTLSSWFDLDLDDSALEVAIVHNRRIRSEMWFYGGRSRSGTDRRQHGSCCNISGVRLDFSALVQYMGVEIGPSISYHQSGGALAASPFLFGFIIESPVQVSQDLLSSTMGSAQEAW